MIRKLIQRGTQYWKWGNNTLQILQADNYSCDKEEISLIL